MADSVLGVIIARGGSRGIPGKNLATLGEHPLLAYTIECARRVTSLDDVILSTDDSEIAETGRRYGVSVPFTRPESLAEDDSHAAAVVQHAAETVEEQRDCSYDVVVTLQPTSPFRLPDHINHTVNALRRHDDADSAVTVCEVDHPPHWMFEQRDPWLEPFVGAGMDYSLRERQQLPSTYKTTGAVFATARQLLLEDGLIYSAFAESGRTVGVETDPLYAVDIDTPVELETARALFPRVEDEIPTPEPVGDDASAGA